MKVLVVEDEFLVAMDLAAVLTDAGYEVVGPVPTVAKALALIDDDVELGLLDINLGGEESLPVADALLARDRTVVFLTGYAARDLPRHLGHFPRLIKPVQTKVLLDTLSKATRSRHC